MHPLFFISWRYLRTRKHRTFFSVSAWVSIIGVAVGVCALIVVLSVMDGLQSELKKTILQTAPHLYITGPGNKINHYNKIIARVTTYPEVLAAAPHISESFLLKTEWDKPFPVTLNGIDPNLEKKVSNLGECIQSGSLSFSDTYTVLVGSELSRVFSVDTGDSLWLISAEMEISLFGLSPRMEQVTVGGVFKTGFYETDLKTLYAPINLLQDILHYEPGQASSVSVRIKDPYHSAGTRDKISKVLQTRGIYFIRTWQEMRANLFTALRHENAAMFIIISLIILVAAFNTVSSLTMMVRDKKREIGILRSVGTSRMNILTIFILCGFIIGCIGTLLGFSGGVLLCFIIDRYKIPLPGGGEIYYIQNLPVNFNVLYMTLIPVSAVIISLLSTIYPAVKAALLQPVEALRHE